MNRPQSCAAIIRVFDDFIAVRSADDVRGWHIDEAWIFGGGVWDQKFRDLLDAISPAITASRGRVHVMGTPDQAGLAVEDVLTEVCRQDEKWGINRDLTDYEWLAILTEEVGEAAQAALQTQHGGPHAGTTRAELIQVAAVALQWIANIDRR